MRLQSKLFRTRLPVLVLALCVGFTCFPLCAFAATILHYEPTSPTYSVGEAVSIRLYCYVSGSAEDKGTPQTGYSVKSGSFPSDLILDTRVPAYLAATFEDRYITGIPTVAGTFAFRYAFTPMSGTEYTKDMTITILALEPSVSAPSIDYVNETLTGLANGNYCFAGQNGTVVAVTGSYAIDSAWFNTNLSIVKKGNHATVADTTPLAFHVPARPAAPTVTAVDESAPGQNNGKITGVNTTMEYSADGNTWTTCAGAEVTGLGAGNYQVRVKAVAGTSFASTAASVTIGAVASNAPTLTGPTGMTLAPGYAATSTGAFSVTGNPLPMVTADTDHGGLIILNIASGTLEIAPGLGIGTYPVTLTASNGVQPDATHTFTLTVKAHSGGSSADFEPTEDVHAYEQAIVVGCKEWANVRSGPSTDTEIVGQVTLGEQIELLQWNKDESWCKILYNGGNNLGWLYRKFIKPIAK